MFLLARLLLQSKPSKIFGITLLRSRMFAGCFCLQPSFLQLGPSPSYSYFIFLFELYIYYILWLLKFIFITFYTFQLFDKVQIMFCVYERSKCKQGMEKQYHVAADYWQLHGRQVYRPTDPISSKFRNCYLLFVYKVHCLTNIQSSPMFLFSVMSSCVTF